ncbi:MAG: hypothetical protein MR384_02375 [Lachnospiraceae bacterium]|nr:hypothetical protein [Lachnospiraceae bacterium]
MGGFVLRRDPLKMGRFLRALRCLIADNDSERHGRIVFINPAVTGLF